MTILKRTLSPWLRVMVGLAWLSLVLFLVGPHGFWRDEVRALSIALHGTTVFEMMRSLRGEGHPALWYLILRGTSIVFGSRHVLHIASVGLTCAGVVMLLAFSRIPLLFVALLIFSGFYCYEYSVVARNYGISAVLMILFALLYPTRNRLLGIHLGLILVALSNTNVHSLLLAGCLMVFWIIDSMKSDDFPSITRRTLIGNTVLVAAGAGLCIATIYPPFNDAAGLYEQGHPSLRTLVFALLLPASSFSELTVGAPAHAVGVVHTSSYAGSDAHKLMSFFMFGALLSLSRNLGAFVAGSLALLALSLFFVVIYPGSYRHEALWVVLILCLLQACSPAGIALTDLKSSRVWGAAQAVGLSCLVTLLALQLPTTAQVVVSVVLNRPQASRIRDLGQYIASNPKLQSAVVMAEPEYLVEALPYYIDNRLYLLRERRYGTYSIFGKSVRKDLNLDEIDDIAFMVSKDSGRPVLILLGESLQASASDESIDEGYGWRFKFTQDQVSRFIARTKLLVEFPASSAPNFAPRYVTEAFYVFLVDAN